MLFSRASTFSNFLIFVLFLGGLLSNGACFAQETLKHRGELHHHHSHHHIKPHHHSHHHSHAAQAHPTHPAIRPIAEKIIIPQKNPKETKIQTEKVVEHHENKKQEIKKVGEEHREHRWHHYWVEHREAGHRWAAEHHIHNPHLIRRSIEFASNTEHGIVALVHSAMASLQHTHYRYGGNYFNMASGVYDLDCSDYVDDLLKISQPKAYADLADSMGTEKPTSSDYYRFFNNLPDNSDHSWQRVDDVESLRAGDILVFHNYGGGGHVMVVMNTPRMTQDDDSTYLVQVSDSASSRHSDDTRAPHVSGVGIGTLLLKANPETGQPSAYAWTVDSGWDHVRVAMAEPLSKV
jgi:cell wall-associated NlpC family hydrolase